MKRSILLSIFTVLSLVLVINANAKIRRVGYFGTGVGGTDYGSVQSAHDAALSGDTLLIFPNSYGTAYFTKKLVVIGYGYWVTGAGANPNLQNIVGNLSLDIRLRTGSDSTVLEGLDGLLLYADYNYNVQNITIQRCYADIRFNNKVMANWKIIQSYIKNMSYAWTGGTFKVVLSNV